MNTRLINTGLRYTGRIPSTGRDMTIAGLAVLSLLALSACNDDDAAQALSDRPSVTFTATDTDLTVPAEVPAGFVDIELETAPGDVGHHLVIARLNDGVTLDKALAAGDEAFFTMMAIKGGNGTIDAGERLSMTLDLEPGNYFALDNPQLPEPVISPFTVVDGERRRGQEPDSEGTVRLGPGMVISVPEGFDATGTWEFVNDDPAEPHEAALVRLADGKTATDVATWGHEGFAGPPPFEGEFGSMGALGPGQRAWITIEPGEPGEYALICFVPGQDGIPHLGQGMVTQVTVDR